MNISKKAYKAQTMQLIIRALFIASLWAASSMAVEELWFNARKHFDGREGLSISCPSNTTLVEMEASHSLDSPAWEKICIQRLPHGQEQSGFLMSPWATNTIQFFRCCALDHTALPARRMRMLHGGHFLTVSPRDALSAFSTTDRHTLYVLYSMLIDPDSGRIAAVYPPFESDGISCAITAMPVTAYAYLAADETPPPPTDCAPADEVIAWWKMQGIDDALLTNIDVIDLEGAVATPGIIDGHLHVSSWSKKLPDEGEQYGFYADVSDPSYYIDPDTGEHYDATEALTIVVSNANQWLNSHTETGIFLHGFVYTMVENVQTNAGYEESFVYERDTGGCAMVTADTNYLLNGIQRDMPPDPQPAILIHTSGQSCWVNALLIQRLNERMESIYNNRFDETGVTNIIPPGTNETLWVFEVGPPPGGENDLFDYTAPIMVDLIVDSAAGLGAPAWIPFELTSLSNGTRTACGEPVLPDIAALLTGTLTSASFVPFHRPVSTCIRTSVWNQAAQLYEIDPETGGKAYGQWDPRHPYESNWYNGAERGLMEYFFDDEGHVWRPTGYAEHYVMRDLLGSVVIAEITADDCIRSRRNLARWCHRHGITSVQDIMYYRRRTNPEDFHAYEALSFEHSSADDPDFFTDRGIDPATRTGHYNLRVGMYYYVENLDQIENILALASNSEQDDLSRLRPASDDPEYPGWIHWTGWKLQLDGGTGARTFFSSAPVAKTYASDPYPTVTENGVPVTFNNHSFGLLTMTSEQEQIFDSRESAALYWLVRESDPSHTHYNSAITRDWSWLRKGVVHWVEARIAEPFLANDLRLLTYVDMTVTNTGPQDEAALMASKVNRLLDQVNSGYSNTLETIARIWYEKSVHTNGLPHQVACHCDGDAGVDLWLRAIQQLRIDVTNLPLTYAALPEYWKNALPENPNLAAIHRGFSNERYRVEHLLNFAPSAVNLIRNPANGIDRGTLPARRNAVFSTQPALLATDGHAFRCIGFPSDQELWEIPCGALTNFWRQLPPVPRYDHHMPCPMYIDYDIPFALNTDPPSVRDPRPAVNLMAAVSRCPIEADPSNWLDKTGDDPDQYPPDYLAGNVYPPLGLATGPVNRMQLSICEALASMTFWSAYNAFLEYEQGALACPWSAPGHAGWYADFVIWENNPLAIRSADGYNLQQLGQYYGGLTTTQRLDIVNCWIEKFRPSLTVVGGIPVYASPDGTGHWFGRFMED